MASTKTSPAAAGAHSSRTERPVRRYWRWPVFLAIFVFAVDLACPSGMTADSIRQVSVAVSLVHWHTLSINHVLAYQVNPAVANTVVGHHVYPYFPWGGALFAVPWVVVYDVAQKLGIGPGSIGLLRNHRDWDIQILAMSTVVAAATVFVYFTALRVLHLDPPVRRRRWAAGVALAFAFTTPAWATASRSMWENGPSMLCLAVAMFFAVRAIDGQPGWTGLGLALGCGYAMRPTDSLAVFIFGVWVLGWQRQHALRVIAGGVPPLAIFLIVNQVAYHHLLTPYYTQGQSFDLSSTTVTAAAGNLISPSRGLIVFVPLVLFSYAGIYVRKRQGGLNPFWMALALYPVGQWILLSPFKHWWGGDSYGPRLWTDLMPVFTLMALPAVEWLAQRRFNHQKAVAILVSVGLVWGLFVESQGAILRSAWCWNNVPTDVDVHPGKIWSWSDPQFLRGVRTLVWGPDRHSEFIRDGVDRIGCPQEPVRP